MLAIYNINFGWSEAFLGGWISFQYFFDTEGSRNKSDEIIFITGRITSGYVSLNDIRQVI